MVTKSNLILGMGETRAEVSQALLDLHDAGTELITITQYLRPSPDTTRWSAGSSPRSSSSCPAEASEIGFAGVMSGPLVRSSYRAGRRPGRRQSLTRIGSGGLNDAKESCFPTWTLSAAVPEWLVSAPHVDPRSRSGDAPEQPWGTHHARRIGSTNHRMRAPRYLVGHVLGPTL